jgi:dipeptidyl aminopeptidase/acylaminoacyl peptidase
VNRPPVFSNKDVGEVSSLEMAFISNSFSSSDRPMTRKVTFTPRRFLRKIWQFGTFDVSPDGQWLAYSANKGDQWTVYVRDLKNKREKVLVKSDQSVLNPEFSPDGQWIAVQIDFEGDENFNIYIVRAKGGVARKLTDTSADSAFPRWSPDGTKIAFISNRVQDRENIFVMEVAGDEAKQLTYLDDIVNEIAWRPDGRSVAFSAGFGIGDWVGIVDLDRNMEKLVAFPNSENYIAGDMGRPEPWSPDGKELAFASNIHDSLDIGILDLDTREVRWLVTNRWDKTMPLWSHDGRRIGYLENHHGNIELRTVAPSGNRTQRTSPSEGAASHAVWHPNSQGLFYTHSTFVKPHEIVYQQGNRISRIVGGSSVRLPHGELVMPELIWYVSFDGRRIPAWIFVPPRRRTRRAAIVDPHGGPEAQVINEWDAGYQFMVSLGYTLLAPNYRGGTGYGRAWRRISDHDLGGGDMKDIIAGGRWLLERKYCPPDRLGIIGASYGGYSVAHCLEQAPELWAVGVSIVGFFNWLTATKNERGNLQMYDWNKMGTVEQNAELLRNYSPLFYLEKIRAPVCFTGGVHDPRCPVTEARQMVEQMRKTGKTVDYLEFEDEGHWPRKISNQIRLYDHAFAWLSRFLPDI